MPDEKFHMWTYLRDKYGVRDAVESFYESTVAADPLLKQAIYNIISSEALIDNIMGNKEDEEDPNA